MEFLVEFVFELLLEGGLVATYTKRIPKAIRYILTALIALFFTAVATFLIVLGVLLWRDSILGGALLIFSVISLLVSLIVKMRNAVNS